uniref:Ig-like domain-containing protein n=1 Tax=Oryzias latipes TaxID=8090 RepID=A0A3B3HN21_ORYLA
MSVLVPLLLFLWSTDGSSAQPHQVVAVVGDAVTLPCSLEDRTRFDDSPTVEWTRADLDLKAALVYRDNSEVFEMKHQRFEFRTSLFHSVVKDGNVSLRISNVQLSDAGMFYCLKIPKEEGRLRMENSTVELVVVSAFDPKITGIWFGSNYVVMECEARNWRPKPQMKILDEQGRALTGEKAQTEDPGGVFTIRQRVTLQRSADSHRIVCRVELPRFNHSRTTQILISDDQMGQRVQWFAVDCLRSYFTIAGICAMILLTFFGFFLWRRKLHRYARACLTQTMPETCVRRSFQQRRTDPCETENSVNSLTEQQERELNNLKSDLQKKDELIKTLKRQLSAGLKSCVVHHTTTHTGNLLGSFESDASSSENDQEPLENRKLLKSSSFSRKKHPLAEISRIKKDTVSDPKVQRKKTFHRMKSLPTYDLVDDTHPPLSPTYLSGQENLQSQRRASLQLSALGDNYKT